MGILRNQKETRPTFLSQKVKIAFNAWVSLSNAYTLILPFDILIYVCIS